MLGSLERDVERETLRRCLSRTARETGISIPQAVNVLATFLDEAAQQLSRGRLVHIPGFGIFATVPAHGHRQRYPQVTFSPSRQLWLQTLYDPVLP